MRPLPVRTGLFVTMAFSLVLLYLIWWSAYTNVHYESRYTPQPPGAAAEVHGTSVRLLSLTQSDQLTEVGSDQPPKVPDPGAVWIVAELEAVRHGEASEFLCRTRTPDGPLGGDAALLRRLSSVAVTSYLPFQLTGLAADDLARVLDALALVGLRRTDLPDLGRDLTDELLVDAARRGRGSAAPP